MPAQCKYEDLKGALNCTPALKALTLGRNTEGDFVSDGKTLRCQTKSDEDLQAVVTASVWRSQEGYKEDVVSDLSV